MIELTEAAVYDLASIDNATAATWGATHAERYHVFLRETFSHLSENSTLGQPISPHNGLFVFVARYSKRRSAHGHRIFYRKITDGIRVIRVLHTAMNWTDVLGGDEP